MVQYLERYHTDRDRRHLYLYLSLSFDLFAACGLLPPLTTMMAPLPSFYRSNLPWLLFFFCSTAASFAPVITTLHIGFVCHRPLIARQFNPLSSTSGDKNNLGVIDLTDDDDDFDNSMTLTTESGGGTSDRATVAPFLSQGELSDDPNLLNPDFTDPKQTRVIIYIILTLVPILFLIPLMIGSRDLIPLDSLPPVTM